MIDDFVSLFKAHLLGNWDHFGVPFWDLLDVIGLTAYYPLLSSSEKKLTGDHIERERSMVDRWRMIRLGLNDWLERRAHAPFLHRAWLSESSRGRT